MPVEFTIAKSELRQAMQQLKVNRDPYADSDVVDILVSESSALFRAVGTESEAPVNGAIPGSIRVPLRIVDKISEAPSTLKKKELAVHCEPGAINIGTFSLKHPQIELNKAPNEHVALPINMSLLDTLALAKILTPVEIAGNGMRKRVEDAEHSCRSAIRDALTALQSLEIEDWQLSHFVDCHIQGAAQRLRKNLGSV